MDLRVLVDVLLQHLLETTIERNSLRSEVHRLEQQLAARDEGGDEP